MTDKTKTIGTATFETGELVKRLMSAANAGTYELITYAELTKVIGFDVQREGRGYLSSARKIAEKETGKLFTVVPGQGIKLAEPTEQLALGVDSVCRVKRATKRAIDRIGMVEVEKLNDSQRVDYHTTSSVLGALHLFSSDKSVKKVAGVVEKQAAKLDVGDTLKLFK